MGFKVVRQCIFLYREATEFFKLHSLIIVIIFVLLNLKNIENKIKWMF